MFAWLIVTQVLQAAASIDDRPISEDLVHRASSLTASVEQGGEHGLRAEAGGRPAEKHLVPLWCACLAVLVCADCSAVRRNEVRSKAPLSWRIRKSGCGATETASPMAPAAKNPTHQPPQ
ncbi:hypothetical protein G5V59_19500 [Nocardioides sp. W3-2-3]|nr:hypothetical protein [Nocardioides convexus]